MWFEKFAPKIPVSLRVTLSAIALLGSTGCLPDQNVGGVNEQVNWEITHGKTCFTIGNAPNTIKAIQRETGLGPEAATRLSRQAECTTSERLWTPCSLVTSESQVCIPNRY